MTTITAPRSIAVFVNVYALSSHYGGPEEGGWDYTAGTPVVSKATTCIDAHYEDSVLYTEHTHKDVCPAGHWKSILRGKYNNKAEYSESYTHDANGVSWMDSADDAPAEFAGELIKSGSYEIRIEDHPGEDFPSEKPHYE
tara:strand:- start:4397 stop:4816 length:420 start_codon:yes stop_codon:yes gene_type:complete